MPLCKGQHCILAVSISKVQAFKQVFSRSGHPKHRYLSGARRIEQKGVAVPCQMATQRKLGFKHTMMQTLTRYQLTAGSYSSMKVRRGRVCWMLTSGHPNLHGAQIMLAVPVWSK